MWAPQWKHRVLIIAGAKRQSGKGNCVRLFLKFHTEEIYTDFFLAKEIAWAQGTAGCA